MPALMSVMVDDQIRVLNAKFPPEKTGDITESLPLAFICKFVIGSSIHRNHLCRNDTIY